MYMWAGCVQGCPAGAHDCVVALDSCVSEPNGDETRYDRAPARVQPGPGSWFGATPLQRHIFHGDLRAGITLPSYMI